MSGFVCAKCGERVEIFKSGGGEAMAKEMDVTFLGKIPLEADIVEAGDSGKPFMYFYSETVAGKIMEEIIEKITKN
jgi:MinD superfamily P-loop ATPase